MNSMCRKDRNTGLFLNKKVLVNDTLSVEQTELQAYRLMQKKAILISKCRIDRNTEPVLLNVYGAPELIPRNEFRQPM